MGDVPGAPGVSLRPGGGRGVNPFAAFSHGAGVKPVAPRVAPSSSTPHKALLDARKEKLGVELVGYTRDFLLQFAERNTRPPAGMIQVKGLIVDEVKKAPAPVAAPSAAAGADNWRSKTAAAAITSVPEAPDAGGSWTAPSATGANSAMMDAMPLPPATGDVARLMTAEEFGRKKWEPAKDLTDSAQAVNKLRGILNKLTPDNFEKLVVQVLSIMSTSAETLRLCIPLVFEKAVLEPTFCALYAELCTVLTNELASHDFGQEGNKPVTFKRELLNTCQDEFEGMEAQRARLDASAPDAEYAKRMLKMRQLGTIRLLAELFKKELVTVKIMQIVVEELMSRAYVEKVYDTDLLECITQAITIAGEKMSDTPKLSKDMKSWLSRLDTWSNDRALEARLRFKIKDLQDLVRAGWRSRRETNTVKKTEEVRRQAQAELGLTAAAVPDFLPSLPGMGGGNASLAPTSRHDESVLFPGMAPGGLAGVPGGPGVRASPPDAAQQSSAPAKGRLSSDEVRKKARATFEEFVGIKDHKEVAHCVRDIAPSEAQEGLLVEEAVRVAFNVMKDSDAKLVTEALVQLADQRLLSAAGLEAGLKEHTSQLDELAIDVPKAPKIIGTLLAAVISAQALEFKSLTALLKGVEMVDSKRLLARYVLQALAVDLGEAPAAQMVKESEVHLLFLLDADKELEPDAPTVFDYMKTEGLDWVPL